MVEELFGNIPEKSKDQKIENVLKNGKEYFENINMKLRRIYPIIATKDCTKCHTNAKEGSVMGAIEIIKDEKSMLSNIQNKLIFTFILLLPFPVALSYFVGGLISKKIENIASKISTEIKNIEKLNDLKRIDIKDESEYYEELKSLLKGIKSLMKRVKQIAIDKDILELEIKLTEKLIITSELIKEWHEYIKYMLLEVNNVANVYYLFTVFINGSKLNVDIFWKAKPEKEYKELFEKLLKSEIVKKNLLKTYNLELINIEHHVADSEKRIGEINKEDLITKTKSIFLEKPKIGGIVGIGIGSDIVKDNNRYMVVDSILATLINITGSVRAISKYIKEIEFYAMRDPLTYLYNQRVFWEFLSYEVERAKRHNGTLALIFMDLDNFKYINDTFGHTFGNLVIKEVARVINETRRKEDIAFRFGGDEFVLLLTDVSVEDAYNLAERIRKKIESISLPVNDNLVSLSISMGISHYPENGETPKELFIVADRLAQKAKEEGKNKIKLPTIEDVAEEYKKSSEKALKIIDAMSREKIEPFFQPIVNIKDNSIIGYEALMRIKGISSGIGEYIEIAENIGIIPRLDMILIEKALKKYQKEESNLYIFLNLSVRDIISLDVVKKLNELTKIYKINRNKVVLELTERESLKNLNIIKNFVRSLKKEGYLFAIDDFGSGYSTFKYLKEFPVDIVKIDGDFIKGMVSSEKDKIFVKSLINLGKGMNLKILAEFVENEEILKIVKELDIDYAQGFYFGKPSPDLI
ncbi:putative bifunctional diguanylate cyclase/phosphodiesterase [Persephonella hydrogeniphila]|uniref:putative bifunctional diguanylate cyclase/phosphodiesterase n=1 Tax=Persephonella hydrogeniphila TaxID=198703 RepID=UPI0015E0229C|nr:GGDEF domain-containing phosphodiesterase [Persephonella hydrogeniphila]